MPYLVWGNFQTTIPTIFQTITTNNIFCLSNTKQWHISINRFYNSLIRRYYPIIITIPPFFSIRKGIRHSSTNKTIPSTQFINMVLINQFFPTHQTIRTAKYAIHSSVCPYYTIILSFLQLKISTCNSRCNIIDREKDFRYRTE